MAAAAVALAEHQKCFNAPPDFFTAGGMAAAMQLVKALKKSNGDTGADKGPFGSTLIPA